MIEKSKCVHEYKDYVTYVMRFCLYFLLLSNFGMFWCHSFSLKKSQILLTKNSKYFFRKLKKYFWPILGKHSIFKEIFLSYLFLLHKWFVYLLQFHNPNPKLYLVLNFDLKTSRIWRFSEGFGYKQLQKFLKNLTFCPSAFQFKPNLPQEFNFKTF